MSITSSESRPFPVRFDPDQRERLDLMSQLTGRSATDIVREGTERLLDELSAKPDIQARVENLVAEIRKDAEERQAAVHALFDRQLLVTDSAPFDPITDEPDGTAQGDPASDPDDRSDASSAPKTAARKPSRSAKTTPA